MAYGMQNIRPRNIFNSYDQLTPQRGSYMNDVAAPVLNPAGQPLDQGIPPYDPGPILGPDGQPLDQQTAPSTPPPPQVQQRPPSDPGDYGVGEMMNAINKVYTPENTSRDRNDRLLDNYPGEYSPTKSDRWSAVLLGLGAGGDKGGDVQGTMDKVLQAPRMRDIEDWKNKAVPFGQASTNEAARNNQERQLAGNVVTGMYNMEKTRVAQQKIDDQREIGLIRANAYRAKQEGAHVIIDKGSGRIITTWPDGRKQYDRIPGSSTAAELADIEGKYDVKAAEARATGTMENTIAQGYRVWEDTAGNKYLVNERGPNKTPIPVQGSPATPQGGITPYERPLPDRPAENLTPAQKAEAQQNEVQSYYDRAPANVRKLFRGSGKTLKLGPRPADTWTGWGQAEREKEQQLWDKTQQEMFGQQKGIGPSGQAAPPKTENKPIGPPTPEANRSSSNPYGSLAPAPTTQRPIDVANAAREKAKSTAQQAPAPQRRSRADQEAEVAGGRALEVVDPKTMKSVGTVPNTPAGRAEAKRLGYGIKER